ncbi:unnamed protein product [Aphanomyces euteiches]|nr:hypothetical protein AeRB84_006956 [Aphanomyces euteiches]
MDRGRWESAVDATTGREYYFNRATEETSWTKPEEQTPKARVVHTEESAAVLLQALWRARKARDAMQTLLQTITKRIFDPTTQAYFYYNERTGQSSWMTPRGLKTKPKTSSDVGVEPLELPDGWSEAFDDATQRFYYVNESTGESSWTIPSTADSPRIQTPDELENGFGDDEDHNDQVEQEEASPIQAAVDETASDKSLALHPRRYPRSKAQLIVDAAEDAELDDIPVHELNLSNVQATKLSSRIWNLDHLERLDVSGNRLSRIPSGIQDLTMLTFLDVSHNELTTLPTGLQTTVTLRHLDASHNCIASFSPKLWKLRGLEHLDLSHNAMTELPFVEGDLRLLKETGAWQVGVGLLTKLTALDLSHNRLAVCPMLLDKCEALKTLELSYNCIPKLDPDFGNLAAVESCRLEHNELEELPESTSRMAQLQTLIVHHNKLQSLPASIGGCVALTVLDLSSNKLTELPQTLQALVALKRLDLAHNPQLVFPNVLPSLSSLEFLELTGCNLPDLPSKAFSFPEGALPAIHSILLSHNQLTELPLDIELLKQSLQVLQLAHNRISHLPTRLFDCAQLTELDLSHNQLTDLPPGLANLKCLTRLDLSFNKLVAMPDDSVHLVQLKTLRLAHNNLQTLPGRFGFLKKLEHWDVSYNALKHLPSTCHHMAKLKFVNASFNQLETRPPFFHDSKTTFVDWSHNPFEAKEEAFRAQLNQVAAAKQELDKNNYDAAATVFSRLLFDLPIRPYRVLDSNQQTVRVQASFYRGICRYQQIVQAMAALETLADEAAHLERFLHEDELTEHRFHSEAESHTARLRLDQVIAERVRLRSSMRKWQSEAATDLQRAVRYKMEPITASFTLGCLYLHAFQLPEAIDTLTATLTYFSDGITQGAVPVLLQRAVAWELLGQPIRAKDDYNLVLAVVPFHEQATQRLADLETHQAKYHAGFDTEAMRRAFVMEPNGICHRRNDPMISTEKLNEIDSPAAFAQACDDLRDAHSRKVREEKAQWEEERRSRERKVAKAQERRREVRETLALEKEEEGQRERELQIEFARRQKQLELMREENERQWMQYEEATQRWVESERERIRLEEEAALEEARKKELAKAEYKKRLARRGGLRQGGRKGGRV